MKELLVELEKVLIEVNNPIVEYLNFQKDFQKDQFLNVLDNLKLTPTEELLELYSWKTGLQTEKALSPEFNLKMFSFGNHIDYNSTSSLYILDKSTDKLFVNRFLPIIYYGVLEDPILIDLSKKSKTYGQIFYYCPSITFSDRPVPMYNSLESWIKTTIECYKQGVYSIAKDGSFSANDHEADIVKKYNRNVDFWD